MAATTSSEPKFRFHNRRALLTYREHLHKDDYINWFTMKVKCTPEFIRLAHENGQEDTPYEHTHVLVDIGKNFQTINCRFFDYLGCDKDGVLIEEPIHPNIKTLKNAKALEDAKKYIAKEDPENKDLLKKSIIKGIMNCDTAEQALEKYCSKPSDALGILAIHNIKGTDYRTEIPDWSNFVPRPWQNFIVELIDKPVTDRVINWIYDKMGGAGKSTFGDYLEDMYPEKIWVADDLGNSREAATIIQGKLASGWRGNVIWIDLTRNTEHHERMYDYLERLINGRITAQKYKGTTLRFNRPHVIVSANYIPQVDKMTHSKWNIMKMEPNFEVSTMTVEECRQILGGPTKTQQKLHSFYNK